MGFHKNDVAGLPWGLISMALLMTFANISLFNVFVSRHELSESEVPRSPAKAHKLMRTGTTISRKSATTSRNRLQSPGNVTLLEGIPIPAWRSLSVRQTFQRRVKKLGKGHPKSTEYTSMTEPYVKRGKWIPQFTGIKNDVPMPMLHMFFGMWSNLTGGKFDLPTLAKDMDLGGLDLRLLGGADVNEADSWGRTASHYAVINADAAMLQLLAAHKANLSAADQFGNSPLSLIADPWRQARSSAWASMAANHGVVSALKEATDQRWLKTATPEDPADVPPSGWVERTELPWSRAHRGGGIDTISASIPIATLQKEYLFSSKPFKVSGAFRACGDLLSAFGKESFVTTDLMSTKVTPGRIPYGEDGKPMERPESVSDFVRDHMGATTLRGNITYKTAPLYVFQGVEEVKAKKPKGGRTPWMRIMKKLSACMAKTVPWLKDFGVMHSRYWTVGLGGGGSGAPFHAHAAAVNVAVVGHKLWHIYPPYVSNYTSDPTSIWHNRNDAEELEAPVTFEQHPGDLVFLPGSWAHSTMCLGDSISFSAVLPNSMNGYDIEPEAQHCMTAGGHCHEIDRQHPGLFVRTARDVSVVDAGMEDEGSHWARQ